MNIGAIAIFNLTLRFHRTVRYIQMILNKLLVPQLNTEFTHIISMSTPPLSVLFSLSILLVAACVINIVCYSINRAPYNKRKPN
jgi:hypothetical protein